jgi:hypothetical protein
LFFLNGNLNKAYEDHENAKLFFNNLPANADPDLIESAIYNLKSTEHNLNYTIKRIKIYR